MLIGAEDARPPAESEHPERKSTFKESKKVNNQIVETIDEAPSCGMNIHCIKEKRRDHLIFPQRLINHSSGRYNSEEFWHSRRHRHALRANNN